MLRTTGDSLNKVDASSAEKVGIWLTNVSLQNSGVN